MSAPLPTTTSAPSLYTLRKRMLTNLALAIAAAAQRLRAITVGQTEASSADLRAALALIRLAPKILSELPSDPDCDEAGDYEVLPNPAESVPPVSPPAETNCAPAQSPKPTPLVLSANARDLESRAPISKPEIPDLKSEISNRKSPISISPASPPTTDHGPLTTDSASADARCNRCGLIHGPAPCPDRRDPRALALAARAEILARAVARNNA